MASPAIATPRLLLRPFAPADASRIHHLLADPAIADTTLRIPHPYPDGEAERWIATHPAAFASKTAVRLALVPMGEAALVGCVGLEVDKPANSAELGFWVGVPFWSKGYATEAARALVAWVFSCWGLSRVHACHFVRNPAAAKVMENIGMRRAASQGNPVCKAGCTEDIVRYEIFAPGAAS